MNRTINDATAKRYQYKGHEQLRHHLEPFLDAHNHAHRLKSLKGLTPARFIRTEWQPKPELFYKELGHLTAGLNTSALPRRSEPRPAPQLRA